jgi:hypothetical protein
MKSSSLLIAAAFAALAVATTTQAHVSYTNRNFGTLVEGAPAIQINTATVSSGFGWADATDADYGDSHRLRAFRFTLDTTTSVSISVQRNTAGTGPTGTFLPAFSLYSGLTQRGLNEGVFQGETYRTEALAHDGAANGVQSLVDQFGSGNGSGLGGSGKEGAFLSLNDFTIGNDPTYVTAGDPGSGILIAARLATLFYVGHAADGTSDNYGSAAGINGDGNADGFVTAVFTDLAPGNYSLFIGGANYALQGSEVPTYPTYGINVSVAAIPEPSSVAALAGFTALGLASLRRRRR